MFIICLIMEPNNGENYHKRSFPYFSTLHLNVGGTKFVVRLKQLERYSQTRLGRLAKTFSFLCDAKNLLEKSFLSSQPDKVSKACMDKNHVNGAVSKESIISEDTQIKTACRSEMNGGQILSDEVARLEAELRAVCDECDLIKGRFFFDRDPVSFAQILELYRTDELHLPAGQCGRDFQFDLAYWGIGPVLKLL